MGEVRRFLGSRARSILGTLTAVVTTDPVVALTFDDGPHQEFTPRVLEILRRHHAHATFFMVGAAAQKHQDIVRQVAQEGHTIGGHSWDHRSFPSLSSQERRRQMRACEQVLSLGGERLFRPPYGYQTVGSRLDAFWRRYEIVGWNVDSTDWREDDPEVIADCVIRRLHPGCVVLLHDALFDQMNLPPGQEPYGCVDRHAMLSALEMILERVGTQFQFVTIPELIRRGVPFRDYWFRDGASCNEQKSPSSSRASSWMKNSGLWSSK